MNRWLYRFKLIRSEIWFRASLYAVFGIAAAVLAAFAGPFVPKPLADRLGGESVEQILTILASSLLAVATFSLGAWVSAYTAVSQAATPRVASLVTADEQTQKALATFVGAFLYAVVAVTAANAHVYGAEGRAILYLTSLGVVGLVAYRLLSWINRLSGLARLSHMIELVERHTSEALHRQPPCGPSAPVQGATLNSPFSGYVCNIDLSLLQEAATRHDFHIEVTAPVGAFRRKGEPIARVSRDVLSDDMVTALQAAWNVERWRSFDQDPRYGLIVLSEIAARALSPAVNDPGTAIQISSVAVRLLNDWGCLSPEDDEDDRVLDRVSRPPLDAATLLQDVFGPIIRYGSGDLTVATRVHKSLISLESCGGGLAPAASLLANEAAERARSCLPEADRARFDRVVKEPKLGD